MRQCACGTGYCTDCGRRAPTVRRDAAYTARTVAQQNKGYGAATGGFWAICAVIGLVPRGAWPVIGIIAGAVTLLVLLSVILKKRAKVDTGTY